jgi:hypothetical protein
MHNRLSHHVLVPEQLWFRGGMSGENADTLLKFVNQNMHSGGIFCDLAKAIDGE